MKSVIVHYQEIALKGRNRPYFVERLVRNLRESTADLDVAEVRALVGRIELVLGPAAEWDAVRERLRRAFGVANFAQAGRGPLDLDALAAEILRDLGDRDPASFRVSARRADKRFPLTSPEIERELGGRIKMARGWRVDLEHPALTIHVEFLTKQAFYSFGREPGAGGLPAGVSGRVACLLSGGIDSPVAAYRMMRRGCRVHFVHFHSYPILSRASQEKVRELSTILTRYQLQSRLYLVAFGEIQQQVVLSVPAPLRVVIYRRLMMRIAERLARRSHARALVTGEVVGQVASQTLENLAVIGSVAAMPILRPLVGCDKDEITAEAQALGTYPVSIIPDQDCCTLFTPRHPATRARLSVVEKAERALRPSVDEIVEAAVAAAIVEDFQFPVVESKAASREGTRNEERGMRNELGGLAVKLTPGKLAGMKAVSNARGVIAAAAMDQRGSLQKALAKEKGGEITDAMLEEFKSLVTEVLTPHASAILLDPEWGLPASKRRAKNAGLLLAYEKTGYDKTGPGRLPDLLDHWSVRRLKEADADCVKILLYYTPFDPKPINDRKHAWVERIGDECRANDIPFFLEFVCYEEGVDEKGFDFARKKPEAVVGSMAEFTKDRYGVDVMKVEVPVNMKFVEGAKAFGGEKAYSKADTIDWFRRAAGVATRPFIYLSAGVSNAEFTESLALATEADVRFAGVLCGRATWKDGIPVYGKQGAEAFRAWLQADGVKNINNVNDGLKAASAWYSFYGVSSPDALA